MMAYSAPYAEIAHRLAYYVDRILKGTAPGDLPIEQPTTFELSINLKTAQALGLEVPTIYIAAGRRGNPVRAGLRATDSERRVVAWTVHPLRYVDPSFGNTSSSCLLRLLFRFLLRASPTHGSVTATSGPCSTLFYGLRLHREQAGSGPSSMAFETSWAGHFSAHGPPAARSSIGWIPCACCARPRQSLTSP